MVKIVVSIKSEKVLYSTFEEVDLQQGEVIVYKTPKIFLLKPFYNFETEEFYEGATPEEITESKIEVDLDLNQRISELENELHKIKSQL